MLVKLFMTSIVVWTILHLGAKLVRPTEDSKIFVMLGCSTIITVLLGVATALQAIWF